VAAVRAGHIDAIVNVEPAITLLERSGAIAVVTETVSEKGSRAVFGEALPAGSLYTKEEFLKQYPNTAQALVDAMVRALLWLDKASAEQIVKTVPAEYTLGERSTYLAALERQRQGFSKDGLIPPAAAAALHRVLQRFDPAVQEARDLDITQAYDNRFAEQALRRYRR